MGAEHINYREIVDGSNTHVLQFNIDENNYSSRSNYTLCASRNGLKFTTPSILLKNRGKHIRVYQDVLEFDENELFRIKAVDFSISKKYRRKQDIVDPYFTKSGTLVIPKAVSKPSNVPSCRHIQPLPPFVPTLEV